MPLSLFPYPVGSTFIICWTAVGIAAPGTTRLSSANRIKPSGFFVIVSLCNTRHPLTPPARRSRVSPGPLFRLFHSGGAGFLHAEKQTRAPALVRSAVVSWVLDPVLQEPAAPLLGDRHVIQPEMWGVACGKLLLSPGCQSKSTVKQQKHPMVCLCVHSANVSSARPRVGTGNRSQRRRSWSLCPRGA